MISDNLRSKISDWIKANILGPEYLDGAGLDGRGGFQTHLLRKHQAPAGEVSYSLALRGNRETKAADSDQQLIDRVLRRKPAATGLTKCRAGTTWCLVASRVKQVPEH